MRVNRFWSMHTPSPWLTTLGWLASAVMAMAVIGMFATWAAKCRSGRLSSTSLLQRPELVFRGILHDGCVDPVGAAGSPGTNDPPAGTFLLALAESHEGDCFP
jgi:hypothetical protein